MSTEPAAIDVEHFRRIQDSVQVLTDSSTSVTGMDVEIADWSKLSVEPVVSVHMITYQHAPYIRQALDSVLMQQVDFPIEICLGEDGSTDGTRVICHEYAARHPDKIRLFLRDRNNPARQRYRGPFMHNSAETLKACRGRYIALLEGDDYWTHPFKLQKQVNFLESNPDYALCFHKSQILENGSVSESPVKVPHETTSLLDVVSNPIYIHTHSVVFRNTHECPDVYLNSPTGDYVSFVLAAERGKIRCLREQMGVYRIGANNAWLNQSLLSRMEAFVDVQDALIEHFKKKQRDDVVAAIRRSEEARLASICKMHYQNGNSTKLRAYELKLVSINPAFFYAREQESARKAKESLGCVDFVGIKLRGSMLGKAIRALKKRGQRSESTASSRGS